MIVYNTGSNGYPCYWHRSDSYASYFISDGSWSARVWWSNSYQDEWLITYPIDLTGYEAGDEILFGFSSGFYGGGAPENTVNISTNGGSSWDQIVDLADELNKVDNNEWKIVPNENNWYDLTRFGTTCFRSFSEEDARNILKQIKKNKKDVLIGKEMATGNLRCFFKIPDGWEHFNTVTEKTGDPNCPSCLGCGATPPHNINSGADGRNVGPPNS